MNRTQFKPRPGKVWKGFKRNHAARLRQRRVAMSARRVSSAEKTWTKAVREKDNYTCQRCGKYDKFIHTHHVAPRSRRPDLKLAVANGICLDTECHAWVHANPIAATEQGLLSDATYELAMKEKAA